MLMILPHCCGIMCRSERRVHQNVDHRFQRSESSRASSVRSTTAAWLVDPPALLTMMSIRPNFSTAVSTTRSQSSRTLASPETKITESPASISFSACWPFSSLRPLMTTLAPSRTKASPMARPMPLVPPVTAATLPSNSMDKPPLAGCLEPNTRSSKYPHPRAGDDDLQAFPAGFLDEVGAHLDEAQVLVPDDLGRRVHHEHRAAHVRGLVGGQEQRRICDVDRHGRPADGGAPTNPPARLLEVTGVARRHVGGEAGDGAPWRDGVDPDAVLAELRGHRLGEGHDRVLGRGVHVGTESGAHAGRAGHVDHVAAGAGHDSGGVLRAVEDAVEQDRDRPPPGRAVDLGDRADRSEYPCVVHHTIEAAEPSHRIVEGAGDVRLDGDV